jgi:hypothetical protein
MWHSRCQNVTFYTRSRMSHFSSHKCDIYNFDMWHFITGCHVPDMSPTCHILSWNVTLHVPRNVTFCGRMRHYGPEMWHSLKWKMSRFSTKCHIVCDRTDILWLFKCYLRPHQMWNSSVKCHILMVFNTFQNSRGKCEILWYGVYFGRTVHITGLSPISSPFGL